MKSSGGSPGRGLQVLHSLAPGSLEGGCCVADTPPPSGLWIELLTVCAPWPMTDLCSGQVGIPVRKRERQGSQCGRPASSPAAYRQRLEVSPGRREGRGDLQSRCRIAVSSEFRVVCSGKSFHLRLLTHHSPDSSHPLLQRLWM